MYKVGVTGGIGSGKTLVCRIFETFGVAVYYADIEARKIMAENKSVKRLIMKLLGKESYIGPELNRGYVASLIFNNPVLLKQINSIVHPAVQKYFYEWVSTVRDTPYVIEEAAILFESGAASSLDTTVMVYASEKTRIQRVVERDGVDPEWVRQRIKNQMGDEDKMRLADHVIMNDIDDMLIPQVIKLHDKFKDKQK